MNRLAGVSNAVCRKYGVHSKEAAIAMAEGIRRRDKAAAGIAATGSVGAILIGVGGACVVILIARWLFH